ncbi:MAG: acetyltransferase [Thermodesulfobacteriota bacterium]
MTNQTAEKYYDVFNGDSDGICALHQLRMAEPRPNATLITGVKRDIRLLDHLAGIENAEITVFDISLDSNRQPLAELLKHNRVCYIDHHYAGELPDSANLESHIHPEPETCTSLIVDRMLDGRFRNWAITGAFGDNLHKSAQQAAAGTTLNDRELEILRELGELLNYNGYGKSVEDLYFHPADLYNALKNYRDPLDFWHSAPELAKLREGFDADMASGRQIQPFRETTVGRIYRFPAAPWCRRVAGVFINEKARDLENMAHALLVDNGNNTIMASIRAPLTNRIGADQLCRAFPTGGGRPAAAGINELPVEMLNEFITTFDEVFG